MLAQLAPPQTMAWWPSLHQRYACPNDLRMLASKHKLTKIRIRFSKEHIYVATKCEKDRLARFLPEINVFGSVSFLLVANYSFLRTIYDIY
jgi:hypothetical protein